MKEKEKEKITFDRLSLPLKIAIIVAYMVMFNVVVTFIEIASILYYSHS